jgi:3-hydroxybutyryl-CoA dehydrogenase
MGSQIGSEYALGGHAVTWIARSPERARAAVDDALGVAAASGIYSPDQVERARGNVRTAARTADVDGPVALVVESIVERLDAKVEVLGEAAAAWPGAILASNTSSLSVARLGEAIGAPERTLGTHYWNPPLLMPLVELIAGLASDEALALVTDTLTAMGKRPVRIDRDVPGFAWNRLQCALLREALWLVDEGVAGPDVVDQIVREGLARRWRYTGPFETAALGGVDTFKAVAANLFGELSDATEAPGLDTATPRDPERLAALAARRDEGLAADLRAEQQPSRKGRAEP